MREFAKGSFALRQAPRHQTLTTENFRHRIIEAVKFFRLRRFFFQIESLRRLRLHSERQLERLDPRAQPRILLALRRVELVQLF